MSSLPPQNQQQYAGPPPLQQTWQQGPAQNMPLPQQKPPPPPDLMDEPLTLNIPSPSSVPAPPIPPNPEKDALLRQLAATLYQMRTRTREQNDSSMQGLQAQRTAMLNAMSTMQSEVGALTQLSNLLQNNTNILRDTMRRADETIENSKRVPEPDIDQLLVAPTVVGNQLYELVAEERALADAIFVLGRAVERGRVAPAVFAKTTRSLAREWYLKKALVKKIGRGMGLHSAV
ncbi:Suppressor protein stp22 of temperature-sensitive alpha-factor receptor and arginine permease [Diaporthe eres]|uniref:Suppressor protein stp22 of temperature-sensitive alpha-factor receptor and arginine permease n=1 Tax=Diaporthe eres TaxID=83184 RepID=A0ABR1NW00_DIAER